MQAAMRALTKAGYTVRTFDYPGFGRSAGTPTHEAIGEAAREHFRRTMAGTSPTIPVILYGRSIGTQVAAENDGRIAGLILDGGSPSFKSLALLFAPMEVHPFIEQFMHDPYNAKEALRRLNHTKVLFIHSKDDHIPYSDARSMYDNFEGQQIVLDIRRRAHRRRDTPSRRVCLARGLSCARHDTLTTPDTGKIFLKP